MESKELVTIEFRYRSCSHTVTIGIFDNLDMAIAKGNEALSMLAERFEVRQYDKFEKSGLFGLPSRLVSNCCYTRKSNGIQYFATITRLDFEDIQQAVNTVFELAAKEQAEDEANKEED